MVLAHATASVSGWSTEFLPWLAIGLATVPYLVAVWAVNRAHPGTRVHGWRVASWLAGVGALGAALVSPIDLWADDLLSVHMVQHLLLAMVAPPLLALGAPITLALRVSAPRFRRTVLLPILHSRAVRVLAWPPLGWIALAAVMWFTHFSPLFNVALENDALHKLEHLLYFGAGCLFWWPVVGADPNPGRLTPTWRLPYLLAQMPVHTAVGLIIYFAPTVLYAHYLTAAPAVGVDPLTDQQVAGALMWGAGDVILLGAVTAAAWAWLLAAERRSRRLEARAARGTHGTRSGPALP